MGDPLDTNNVVISAEKWDEWVINSFIGLNSCLLTNVLDDSKLIDRKETHRPSFTLSKLMRR